MALSARDRAFWVEQGQALHARFITHAFSSTIVRPRLGPKRIAEDETHVTVVEYHVIDASLEQAVDMFVDKKVALLQADARVFRELQQPTARDPMSYIGLRCVASQSAAGRPLREAGMFYLEAMKPFDPADGRRGWACCLLRIGFRASPSYYMAKNVFHQRVFYRGVILVEGARAGTVDAAFCFSVNKSVLPALMPPRSLKLKARKYAQTINRYAKLMHIAVARASHPCSTKQATSSSKCTACKSRMPLFGSRTRCRICHAYVCRPCIQLISTIYPLASNPSYPLCMICAETTDMRTVSMPARNCTDSFPPMSFADESMEIAQSMSYHSGYGSDGQHIERSRAFSKTELLSSAKPTTRTDARFPLRFSDQAITPQPPSAERPWVDALLDLDAMPAYRREKLCDISYLEAFKTC